MDASKPSSPDMSASSAALATEMRESGLDGPQAECQNDTGWPSLGDECLRSNNHPSRKEKAIFQYQGLRPGFNSNGTAAAARRRTRPVLPLRIVTSKLLLVISKWPCPRRVDSIAGTKAADRRH